MARYKFKTGNAEYFLVQIDERGNFIDNKVLDLLRNELEDSTEKYTDVVIMSHGWATEPLEDKSISIGNILFAKMEDRKLPGLRPLYVQIQWPSAVATTFTRPKNGDEKEIFTNLMEKIRETVNYDNNSDSYKKQSCITAIEEVEKNVNNFIEESSGNSSSNAHNLPQELKQSVAKFANEVVNVGERGIQGRKIVDDMEEKILLEDVENKYQEMRRHKNPLARFFGFLFKPILYPGKALVHAIYDIVFGSFQNRAVVVGSRSVHYLLTILMQIAGKHVRFHLCGHSLGVQVVMAGAIGAAPKSTLTRKINSMLFLQGAAPADAFARGSAFRPFATDMSPVAGPILSTFWKEDKALILMDVFEARPLGLFGLEKTKPLPRKKIVVEKRIDESYMQKVDFKKGSVYNLDISDIILDHNDVADIETIDLFWQAATIELDEADFIVSEGRTVPKGHWGQRSLRKKQTIINACLRY